MTTTDEVAATSAATFEAFKTAGGNIDKIEVITDKAEAVKVIWRLLLVDLLSHAHRSVRASRTPSLYMLGMPRHSILGK